MDSFFTGVYKRFLSQQNRKEFRFHFIEKYLKRIILYDLFWCKVIYETLSWNIFESLKCDVFGMF